MAAAFAATDPDGAVVDVDAAAVRDQLAELRRRAVELADADAPAYAAVLAADDDASRREALVTATEIPLQVVEVAHDVAQLAAPLAAGGRPALRGDARVAAVLAAAAARAAAHLVRANVRAGDLDADLVERADGWVAATDRLASGVSG